MDKYFYPNTHGLARQRLCDLELIEDPSTIEQLEALPIKRDWECLEIGAGAGSIARWLSARVAGSGRVIATDIDTAQLDASTCEVWRHDILRYPLPRAAFELAHFRHLLIHLPQATHVTVLASIREASKPSGVLLAEESDLHSRRADPGTSEPLRAIIAAGVRATLAIYSARDIDTALGSNLDRLILQSGFIRAVVARRHRRVNGGSPEAYYQESSARQLAESVRGVRPQEARPLDDFAECFVQRELLYDTRTTVSVAAARCSSASSPTP